MDMSSGLDQRSGLDDQLDMSSGLDHPAAQVAREHLPLDGCASVFTVVSRICRVVGHGGRYAMLFPPSPDVNRAALEVQNLVPAST